jgi:hypothetical protein
MTYMTTSGPNLVAKVSTNWPILHFHPFTSTCLLPFTCLPLIIKLQVSTFSPIVQQKPHPLLHQYFLKTKNQIVINSQLNRPTGKHHEWCRPNFPLCIACITQHQE